MKLTELKIKPLKFYRENHMGCAKSHFGDYRIRGRTHLDIMFYPNNKRNGITVGSDESMDGAIGACNSDNASRAIELLAQIVECDP